MLRIGLAALAVLAATAQAAQAQWGGPYDNRSPYYSRPYAPPNGRGPTYYRPAPRPVVVVHRPAPVMYHQAPRPHNGAAIVFGAVLGALIAHHVFMPY